MCILKIFLLLIFSPQAIDICQNGIFATGGPTFSLGNAEMGKN